MFPRLFIAALGTVAATTVAAAGPAPAPPGNAEKGRTIFTRCAVCHKVDPAAPGGIGPNLSGVYGRPAARVAGFTYSPALKASRLKWDGATLSRFLAAPTKVVPGTKMMSPPLANPQDRADVIAFLQSKGSTKK